VQFPFCWTRGLGWDGQLANNLAVSWWMKSRMGSVLSVSCKWEIRVPLGLVPITRKLLFWTTWSMRQFELHVVLQTGVA
jgi:hypothetical protein